MRLSIVIPAYNLESYIEQCVRSIGAVDASEVEIIVVDDGSTDATPAICDRLSAENASVRVIHRQNGGAAATRNTGMQAAQGESILFVDGDDYLQPGAVEKVLKLLSDDTDILCFNRFTEVYGENETAEQRHLNEKLLLDAAGNVTARTFSLASPLPMPWLYVIKREYILSHEIFMTPGLLDEDEEWTARLFAWQPRVRVIQDGFYMYRRNRVNSLTYGRTLRNSLADIEIIKLLQTEIAQKPYRAVGKAILANKCRQMVNKVLDDIPRLGAADAQRAKEAVKPYRSLLKSGTRPERLHYYMDGILGREKTTRLIAKLANAGR